jgi:hypothetical protein
MIRSQAPAVREVPVADEYVFIDEWEVEAPQAAARFTSASPGASSPTVRCSGI